MFAVQEPVEIIDAPTTSAAPLVKYSVTDKFIADAKARADSLLAQSPVPEATLRADLTTLVRARTTVDKERLKQNELAHQHIKAVNAEAKRVTDKLAPIEGSLQAKWDEITAEKARVRKEKEDAERKIIEEELRAKREAEESAAKAIRDAEEARLKAEREALEAERAKLAEQQRIQLEREELARAERARVEFEREAEARRVFEAEQKAARDAAEKVAAEQKAERERLAAEAAKVEAERQKVEAAKLEADRIEAERQARIKAEQEAVAKAERDRIAAEEARVAEAERQAALAKREAALKPDREKARELAGVLNDIDIPTYATDEARDATAKAWKHVIEAVNILKAFSASK